MFNSNAFDVFVNICNFELVLSMFAFALIDRDIARELSNIKVEQR